MTNRKRQELGRKTFRAYCELTNLEPIERKQHYTATDLIADVLHWAVSRGWDADTILASVQNHLSAECPKGPRCVMCGAEAGKPHHDPGANGKLVTLHRTLWDGKRQPVCMLCRNGLYAMRRDAKILESCPKCGATVTRGESFVDTGEGDEAGRTFYYCSEHCRETH